MRIAILGAGGVGGYFGARLAAHGNDVTFIARGAHAAAMRREWAARSVAGAGDLHLQPVRLHEDARSTGLVDIVLVAVKMYDLDAAAAIIKPLLNDRYRRRAVPERCRGRRPFSSATSAAAMSAAGSPTSAPGSRRRA